MIAEADITVENVAEGVDFHSRIARTLLESMAAKLLQTIESLVQEAVSAAGVDPATLLAVEIIGGGGRTPVVKEVLERAFGRELSYTIDSASAVSSGAALYVRVLRFGWERWKIGWLAMWRDLAIQRSDHTLLPLFRVRTWIVCRRSSKRQPRCLRPPLKSPRQYRR